MKKITILILHTLICTMGIAQQVVLTFSGQDIHAHEYVQLSRIEIADVTHNWRDTLIYPDTVAILTVGVGIEENTDNNTFGLAQNNPNPFSGNTNVSLNLAEAGAIAMDIRDVTGRTIDTWHAAFLPIGVHQFHISIADAGIYFLTACQNGKTTSVKMVNNGNGTKNSIEYVETVEAQSHAFQLHQKNGTKGTIPYAFSIGDAMTYKGYATINGEEMESDLLIKPQLESEEIIFDFTIPFVCGSDSIIDADGNSYHTVSIGNQCWMRENLKTTKYANGTAITTGNETSNVVAYWYYPNNDAANKDLHGLLYNWKAVMGDEASSTANPSGVQGICPIGWHVPSDAEWTQMTDYVSSQSEYICNNYTTYIAKALASTTGWDNNNYECNVGNDSGSNNATNFSAVPSGLFDGNYNYFGARAHFWTSTENDSASAFGRYLFYNVGGVSYYSNDKNKGFSVRCVRD